MLIVRSPFLRMLIAPFVGTPVSGAVGLTLNKQLVMLVCPVALEVTSVVAVALVTLIPLRVKFVAAIDTVTVPLIVVHVPVRHVGAPKKSYGLVFVDWIVRDLPTVIDSLNVNTPAVTVPPAATAVTPS